MATPKSKLTITTPGSVTALTTLDRVKLELGITGSAQDALLQHKIAEASADIEAHIGMRLCRDRVTEKVWGKPNEADEILLGRYPVPEIVSVTVDDTALDGEAGDYEVDPASGLLYRFSDGAPATWCWNKSVVVVYDAGYLLPGETNRNLPEVLEAAAVELVGSYWASRGRDPLVREEDVPGVMRRVFWVGATGATGELPPGVESKIAPFRRMVFA